MNIKLNQIIYSHINDGLTGNGNRSSKRTDKLHHGILECIKNELPDFVVSSVYPLGSWHVQ